jgi:hypothetical protein
MSSLAGSAGVCKTPAFSTSISDSQFAWQNTTIGYTGTETGPEVETALAWAQFFLDSLNVSQNVLRHILCIRLAKKMKGF